MKIVKYFLYVLLTLLLAILLVAAVAGVYTLQHEIHESHDTPYVQADVEQAEKPEGEPLWQVLLLGDAGDSTLSPWHPTLALASELASESPENTTVIMLGDNIYMQGYPNLEQGETKFSTEQKLVIDRLNAQLLISERSGAELFLVPGNHDWYAEQVDSQAEHVARYAEEKKADVTFVPWEKGEVPLPKVEHRPGLSLVFVDSQWLISAEQADYEFVVAYLDKTLREIETQYPENLILVNAHHPVQTMGPHNQFYTSRGYAFVMELIDLFADMDQDTHNPPYQRLIRGLSEVFNSNSRIIYASGHEHSLQVFEGKTPGLGYQLVSGAANQSKVSGVGHNDETQFAVSMEGLMQLSVYSQGVFLEVISTQSKEVIHQQWL